MKIEHITITAEINGETDLPSTTRPESQSHWMADDNAFIDTLMHRVIDHMRENTSLYYGGSDDNY